MRQVPTSIAEFSIPTAIARPTGITAGPDGALWFAEQNANKIGRVTTAGTFTEFDLPANTNPNYLTTGPDGALWFTGPGNNTIGRITTSGTITEFTIPTGGSGPAGITTGPDGALWFAEQDAGKIGRITTAGTFTEYGAGVLSSPYEIIVGSDDNLWFTEINDDKIGMIVPSGVNAGSITLYDLAPGSAPRGITAGSDDNIWFTESGSNIIGRITTAGVISEFGIPTPNSYPGEITSGPGGDLFFSEGAANKIGQITTTGIVTAEYDVPTVESSPNGITFGSDNNVWFVEYIGNQVGSLSLGPVASDDSYTAIQDTVLTKSAVAGVLANDSGTGTLAASVVAYPIHGTLTLNTDGSFTYTPDAGYYGPDSFTYKANDGFVDSNVATVNITVDAPPVAVNDSYKTIVNTMLARNVSQGVLVNDTDADGTPLTAVVVTNPTHGTLMLLADGSFVYTPAAGYTGPDSFTYKANDGTADSNTATVNITVDALPVAVADSYTTDAGTGLVVSLANGVLANDTDADGDTLTAIAVTQPSNGTLFLFASGLNADGTFTYYPNIGFVGTDTFTYKVNDGTADGNTVTVTITVNALPVATDDSYTAIQDTVLTKGTVAGVLVNDTSAGSLTATVVVNPSHGTLTLNTDGSFIYTPDAGYHGPDSFTYKANDGIADSNIATVNLTVDAPPVAVNDSYKTAQDTPLAIGTVAGVLINDTDADGDPITAVVVANPAHGTLTLNTDGSFVYTPDLGYTGPDSFTYKTNDGTADSNIATVNLIVDVPPVAVPDSYTTGRNTPLTKGAAQGVLANDTDAEGDTLATAVVANPAHGTLTLNSDGSFTYTPDTGYSGADSFTYKVTDGTADSNTVTVSIAVDTPPVAVADRYTAVENTTLTTSAAQGVLANDTDADGDSFTAVLVAGPSHGTLTLNGDGSFTYTPTRGYAGPDSFTYAANDGGADGNTVTVTLAVEAPPVAVKDVDGDGRADIIVGSATANSHIKVFSGTDGSLLRSFLAFDGYQGGVASTGGDTNDDGRTDVIAGSATTGSHVKVFDGATGELVRSFLAFQGYDGGVVVASGDVNGDGFADIIVGTRTGGSHVKVFSGADGTELRSFRAFENYAGGVSLASGDVDGDGFADLIVGAATGSAHVKVFSGKDGSLVRSYMAFADYLGGVVVAAGDLNGDGFADVVAGAATGSAHVKAFSGSDGAVLRSFLALPNFTGDLSVAVADADGDGVLDIIAGSRTGAARVTSVNGMSLSPDDSFLAFDNFLGGVAVG